MLLQYMNFLSVLLQLLLKSMRVGCVGFCELRLEMADRLTHGLKLQGKLGSEMTMRCRSYTRL